MTQGTLILKRIWNKKNFKQNNQFFSKSNVSLSEKKDLIIDRPITEMLKMNPILTILIADDDLTINDLLKTWLTSRGYDVFTCYDGISALETFKKTRPHIMLLDDMMPGMSGMDVLREIKKFDSSTRIIMITGLYDEEIRDEAKRLGAYDFFSKPFNLKHLESAIMGKIRLSDVLERI